MLDKNHYAALRVIADGSYHPIGEFREICKLTLDDIVTLRDVGFITINYPSMNYTLDTTCVQITPAGLAVILALPGTPTTMYLWKDPENDVKIAVVSNGKGWWWWGTEEPGCPPLDYTIDFEEHPDLVRYSTLGDAVEQAARYYLRATDKQITIELPQEGDNDVNP